MNGAAKIDALVMMATRAIPFVTRTTNSSEALVGSLTHGGLDEGSLFIDVSPLFLW
jgi:hypothetical protein